MNINNSIQGMSAYTANLRMADTASVQNNLKKTTDVEPNKGTTQTIQEAFQVNITQQALALQSENTTDSAKEDNNQQSTQQLQQLQSLQGRQGSPVDIIA